MVKIRIVAVGKTKEGWIKEGKLHYQKLLRKYAQVELLEMREEKIVRSKEADAILEIEAERILKALEGGDFSSSTSLSVALDKAGRQTSSEGFAQMIEENLNRGRSEFTFVLGGALGLSRRVLDACRMKLSLSQMTFTHEMSRLILLEQIYRAFSILKGTGYHK